MSPKNLNATKILNKLGIKLSNKRFQKLFNLFEKNFDVQGKFIVAVSGGPDSLALAFLTKIYSLKDNLDCSYIIVDHKLREESSEEAKKVKKILLDFDIKAKILTWNGKKPSRNLQAQARKKRYELLFLECKKFKISNLVIGHHFDDLFENFFIRIIRGSGLRGLVSLEKSVKVGEISLIRPLLEFEKKDLIFISNFIFNFYVSDPTNSNEFFQRIKIRKILDDFQKIGIDKNKLCLTLKNLKESDQTIKYYVEQNKLSNSIIRRNKEILLNESFFKQPNEVVFRSFSDSLRLIGGKYYHSRGKKIDSILKKIRKNTLKKATLAGCIIEKVSHTVIISKEH